MPFCDWISLYQVHPGKLPLVNSGRVFSVDQDGQVEWEVGAKVKEKGSYATNLLLSCDGNRVTFNGNEGRFDRPDNVFGYSVPDCVKLANKVLARYDLPPFTDSNPMLTNGKDGKLATIATGAVLTRVDLTKNYSTGSAHALGQYIRHLQGLKAGRNEPEGYQNIGVTWGKGSKYHYDKFYDKAADYLRHFGPDHEHHNKQLYEFMRDTGMGRHEIELKSRYLTQKKLWRFTFWDKAMHEQIYALHSEHLGPKENGEVPRVNEFLKIPGRAGEIALAWSQGDNMRTRLSKNTFYKYRNELLQYGIDIAIQSNVQRLRQRVEIIRVVPVDVPEWYNLPKVA